MAALSPGRRGGSERRPRADDGGEDSSGVGSGVGSGSGGWGKRAVTEIVESPPLGASQPPPHLGLPGAGSFVMSESATGGAPSTSSGLAAPQTLTSVGSMRSTKRSRASPALLQLITHRKEADPLGLDAGGAAAPAAAVRSTQALEGKRISLGASLLEPTPLHHPSDAPPHGASNPHFISPGGKHLGRRGVSFMEEGKERFGGGPRRSNNPLAGDARRGRGDDEAGRRKRDRSPKGMRAKDPPDLPGLPVVQGANRDDDMLEYLSHLGVLPHNWRAIVSFVDSAAAASGGVRWWRSDTALSAARHVGHTLWNVIFCSSLCLPVALWRGWAADWRGGWCGAGAHQRRGAWADAALSYAGLLCFLTWRLAVAFGAEASRRVWARLLPAACAAHAAACVALSLAPCGAGAEPWGRVFGAVAGGELLLFLVAAWAALHTAGELEFAGPALAASLVTPLAAAAAAAAVAFSRVPPAFAAAGGDWEQGLLWRGAVWTAAHQGTLWVVKFAVGWWPAPLHRTHAFHTLINVLFAVWGRLLLYSLPRTVMVVTCVLLALVDVTVHASLSLRLNFLCGLWGGRTLDSMDESEPAKNTLRLSHALTIISDLQAEVMGIALAPILIIAARKEESAVALSESLALDAFLQGVLLLCSIACVTVAAHRQRIPVAGLYCEGFTKLEHYLVLQPAALLAVCAVFTHDGFEWLRARPPVA